MTSSTDICNQALDAIGARATLASLEEVSKEAAVCSRQYLPALTDLFRTAPWGFARRTVVLTELGNLNDGTCPYPWAYKYAYPADCQQLRYIVPKPTIVTPDILPPEVGDPMPYYGNMMPSRNFRFIIAHENDARVILSNVQFALGVYTALIENPELWDSLFQSAMVSSLAARIAIPISGNVQMKQINQMEADRNVAEARAADGNEALASTDHTPDWIAARGTPAWGYGPAGNGFGGLGYWYCGYEGQSWGM